MKSILCFIKGVSTSRLGLILLVIHLAFFIYAIAEKPSSPWRSRDISWPEMQENLPAGYVFVAGRYFHWAYESLSFQALTLIDLPALFFQEIISQICWARFYSQLSAHLVSWVEAGFWLFYGSLQWLFIGYCIERFNHLRKEL
ncbi:MAG TPA: hypothetical protein VNO70_09375 [Blastocatellia bacterium]|nr:hypothetical protein [Blastocatellia bacterium]